MEQMRLFQRAKFATGESLYLDLQINLKELPETIWQG